MGYRTYLGSISKKEYLKILHSEGYNILQEFELTASSFRIEFDQTREKRADGYKASWRIFWNTLTPKQKLEVKKIPHFDSDVFFEITGIRV